MHFFRQLLAYPFGRCNFLDTCFAQPLHGPEFLQKKVFAVLAHPWAIIEDTFTDPFLHQKLVIGIGKTVCFVANLFRVGPDSRCPTFSEGVP